MNCEGTKKATKCKKKKTQYSTYKITTCENFLKITKIFVLSKKIKNSASLTKTPEQKPFIHILHLCVKFQSPWSHNIFFQTGRSP